MPHLSRAPAPPPRTGRPPHGRPWLRQTLGLLVAAGLSACGGDGDNATTAAPSAASSGTVAAAKLERAPALKASSWVTVPTVADPVLQNLTIPASAPTQGMWSGVQNWPLNALHAAVLPNGRLLSYGSTLDGAGQNGRYFDLWDPTLGFGANSHRTTYRDGQQDSFCSASTYLGDGRLMISGGNGSVTTTLYTPATDSVTTGNANLADERWYATMLNLPDGRPVMLGGMVPYVEGMQDNPNQAVAQGLASMTPEVFENGAWRSLFGAYSRDAFGPDYLRASYPRAWVAPDGRVFGVSAETLWYLDPAGNGAITVAGRFKEAPNTATLPNVGATNTAVMYAPGRILVVGGNGSFNGDGLPASAKATSIDIGGGAPRLTEQSAMKTPRRFPNAIVLPTGRVLVTGGTRQGNDNGANAVYAAETWDPASGTWSTGPNAAIYRGYHSFSVLMPDGTVLSTGGGAPGPVTNLNAEAYYPPYLFRTVNGAAQLAPRPVMTALSGLSYAHGDALQVDMSGAGAIAQMVLVGLSTGTHSFNSGQRRIPLAFSQDTYRLTTTVPDRNTVPPGYYQLIAIDAAGVPSRGTIVAIGADTSAPAVATTPYNPPDLSASVAAPVVVAGGTASYAVAAVAGTTYSWDFGDGSAATAFGAAAATMHAYAQPGVYAVALTARAADGSLGRRSFVQAVGATPTAKQPNASGATALETRANASARLWVVNPDNDSVAVIDTATNARVAEIAVGASPRSVAVAPDGRIWVVNKASATLSILDPATLAVARTVALPRASQPHGLVFAPGGGIAFVVLEALGQLQRLDAASGAVQATAAVGANPRHLSISADGTTVLVSRFITPPLAGEGTATVVTTTGGAEVLAVNASTLAISKTIVLRHSDKTDTEIQGAGIPNYLAAAVISPDGRSAWVPSKQDNVKRGTLRSGQGLDFQNTVRAISSRIDLATLAEDHARRVDHDNSSLGAAAVFHPSGAYLFVALETSRQVAVVDAAGGRELFKADVGRAPQALSVSADGRTLYVQNFMDRSIGVLNLAPLVANGELRLPAVATVATVGADKLSAQVRSGKQLFYDARDTRLARDSYMSCASCHSDAGHDGRTWDFTGFGEGLRNTIALKGRAGIGHGFTHWSANGDEIQDFEKQIRDFAGGTGLMTDAQFATGTRAQPLGDRKAGVSADLDALAAYLGSLDAFAPSPLRNADASLTTPAQAGKAVFAAANCASCHAGVPFTISADAGALRNVGTLRTTSGQRLGANLAGLDVPTLRDVWATAPYLHDGSAPTLAAAVQAHSGTNLGATDLTNLVSYLQQIGSEETTAPTAGTGAATPPSTAAACGAEGQTCTLPAGGTATVWYGANGQWAVKTGVAGAIACTNAVFGDPIPGTGKACRYVPETPVKATINLAPTATLATSYVSPWETLAAVADTVAPVNSADRNGGAYGNWQGEANYGRTDWVSFAWSTPKALSTLEVYWWNDGAGIGTPTAASVEYWSGTAWLPLTTVGTALDTFNRATLGVTTTRLRVAMKSAKATGILEARVLGAEAPTPTNIAATATLATSYVSPWETLAAVNNGVAPANSADRNGGAYGNWQGEALYNRTDWVSFTWTTPKSLSALEVYWWNDGAGIGTPTVAGAEFWDGKAWQPLPAPALALNTFNRVEFQVTTTAVRVSMKSARATGILEARVLGADAPK